MKLIDTVIHPLKTGFKATAQMALCLESKWLGLGKCDCFVRGHAPTLTMMFTNKGEFDEFISRYDLLELVDWTRMGVYPSG